MFPNLFKVKYNTPYKYSVKRVKNNYINKSNYINKPKHQPPLIKEWFNSIYAFNKNIVKVLPVLDKNLYNLVNSYFNLYNSKFDKKIKSKRLRIRKRKLSANKLLIGKLNLKHTNEKINVIVYTYNRRKIHYIREIVNSESFVSPIWRFINRKEFIFFIKNLKKNINELELKIKGRTNILLKEIISYLKEKKHVLLTKHNNKSYIVDYVKKHMRKEIISIRHKQSISFEESKYENQYLLPLIGLIERIYNKKVSFNIVNLKYFYNSGSIFSKALMTKLKNRKNKPIAVLATSLSTFELPPLDKYTVYNDMYKRRKFIQNLTIENLIFNNIGSYTTKNATHNLLFNKDALDESLLTIDENSSVMELNTPKTNLNEVIKSLKNKFIKGVRIEIAGRLTKRNTAERSIFKLRYKGNIKNWDSSHKKLPAVLLRGYSKPNLMYNESKSKLRIGAFGLKTWISSN